MGIGEIEAPRSVETSLLQSDPLPLTDYIPVSGKCRSRTLRFLAPPDFKSGCPPMDGTYRVSFVLNNNTNLLPLFFIFSFCGSERIRTSGPLMVSSLANWCDNPLCHASVQWAKFPLQFEAINLLRCRYWFKAIPALHSSHFLYRVFDEI